MGNDGNIYVTDGDLTIENSMNVYGNVYVHDGGAHMENNAQICGELWANEGITINNPASVGTNVISSTGQVDAETDPGGTIGGFAMAGTTIEEAPLVISGTIYENSPQGPPPTVDFPKLCQEAIGGVCDAMPWAGSTVTTATACTAAQAFLDASLSGNQVLWIPSGCPDLQIANNDVINFSGNLAIVTNGMISLANRNTWNGVAGNKLQFIVNYRTGLNCASGAYNVSTGNLSRFSNASVLFYTPVHRRAEQPERLHRAGLGEHGRDQEQLHAELPAGAGRRARQRPGIQPERRLHPRGRLVAARLAR